MVTQMSRVGDGPAGFDKHSGEPSQASCSCRVVFVHGCWVTMSCALLSSQVVTQWQAHIWPAALIMQSDAAYKVVKRPPLVSVVLTNEKCCCGQRP